MGIQVTYLKHTVYTLQDKQPSKNGGSFWMMINLSFKNGGPFKMAVGLPEYTVY